MSDAKVDKINANNDQFEQKTLLQGKDNQDQLVKAVDKTINSSNDINTKIEKAKKNKSDQKIAPTTLTDPQLSKGNQNNYVTKAEKELQHEANVKKYKEKKYEEDVSKEVGQIIIDDEQDIDKNIEEFMTEKSTQQQLAIKEELDEDKKEEDDKKKEQTQRQELEREIQEEQKKEKSILEDDDEEDELLEKEKISTVDVDENENFYTTTPTPKPGMSKPSKEIEELLKQGGDNLNNLLQKTGDDAGKILKENIELYNTFHQQFLNEPNATKRDGLMKEMQDNIQSNPIGDNTVNASMNNIVNDVVDIYDGLRRGDVPTNEPGIVSHNTTAMFGGSNAGSQETGSIQQVEQNKSRSKLPTPIDINLVPPDGVNK